jgi:lipopolysaccharide export system permease protein
LFANVVLLPVIVKKLYKLVLLSFAGPFVATFIVSLFILVMQFLFKYLEDLVGKGLEWHVVARLLMYASVTLVPMALPLAILLSSIMTLGNFGERYELVACKSAGISLRKVMTPLVGAAILIAFSAFLFSNNVLPYANLKMRSLLYDVTNQRPALNIREGVFYSGIDGYVIRVGKKGSDGQTIKDVMIYDHTNGAGNTKLTTAVSGKMVMSADERELIVTLNNGNSYEEVSRNRHNRNNAPLIRSQFEKYVIRFDLSSFKMSRTDEGLFRNNYQMQNLSQLQSSTDTLTKEIVRRKEDTRQRLSPFFSGTRKTTASYVPSPDTMSISVFVNNEKRIMTISSALYSARNVKAIINDLLIDSEVKERSINRYLIEWHRKFTLSFACLILFFIGAPLGAIVRRGGIGLPVIFSVFLFLIYYIISITGEKFAREGVVEPWEGMWLSAVILLPVGIFLTWKATTDSALFDIGIYFQRISNFFRRKRTVPA